MNKCTLLSIALIAMSCSSFKHVGSSIDYPEFEIVNTPLIIEKDTVYVDELRFYQVQSALDGMKLMHQNYGKWNKKIAGIHQQNIHRIVWENVKLIDGNNETFTVIADGTETPNEYFACVMVFDSNDKDCFKTEHPYKEQLTKLLTDKMTKIDKNSSEYKLFR
jgi:hypothetical protein